ncbi:ATPase [Robertkochia marina]|uniref:ATPase n=1 Tax=Robertkochia marina TaxID=1227945 RepID=A0A4S3M4K8_9FLAO|nr:ATPase [Robertkochia marina]THD69840.1 ATPase [Robertkochia marina]TRZ46815.1 ATPase [Robertkochia marina]
MATGHIFITKSSGEKVEFSLDKIKASLRRTGADDPLIEKILATLADEVYDGITTGEVYNRAYAMLKQARSVLASRYKLKRAIYELGPTGFPFEKFIAAILQYSGYHTETGVVIAGKCVHHEVDVLARKNGTVTPIECKFHGQQGINCNVKVPLYIYSRYTDILENWKKEDQLQPVWVATNTRFTKDAIEYGHCRGMYLLSWDLPEGDSLKERIDRLGLYPITASSLLTSRDKNYLLEKGVVLCRDLMKESFYLDHAGISESRQKRILDEMHKLCQCGNHL